MSRPSRRFSKNAIFVPFLIKTLKIQLNIGQSQPTIKFHQWLLLEVPVIRVTVGRGAVIGMDNCQLNKQCNFKVNELLREKKKYVLATFARFCEELL